MKFNKPFLAGALLVVSSMANASLVSWVDWNNATNGSLTVNGSTSSVSITGDAPNNLITDNNHYDNSTTNYGDPSGTFAGLEPTDIIQLVDSGTFTINFGQTVIDPYMALISVGQPNYSVSYTFSDDFSVISSGPEHWVPSSYGYSQPSSNVLVGEEYSGIIQFSGAFDSITFTTDKYEYWHGFNFGVKNAAVPEPSILALFGFGLVGLGLHRRRLGKRTQAA